MATITTKVVAGGVPEDAEAAAIAAAIERFAADTAPPPVADTGDQITGWQRAALLEGVGGPLHVGLSARDLG